MVKQSEELKSSHEQAPEHDTPSEVTLDEANEMSFPASDPISASNITRIEKAPEMAPATEDHQISGKVDHVVSQDDDKPAGKSAK